MVHGPGCTKNAFSTGACLHPVVISRNTAPARLATDLSPAGGRRTAAANGKSEFFPAFAGNAVSTCREVSAKMSPQALIWTVAAVATAGVNMAVQLARGGMGNDRGGAAGAVGAAVAW